MKRSALLATVMAMSASMAAATLLAVPSAQAAADPDAGIAAHVPGQVIVGFRPGTPGADQAAAIAAAGGTSSAQLTPLAANDRLVSLGAGRSVAQAVEALRHNPNVRYADPDYIVTSQATSNDPYYTGSTLWGMYGDATSPANQYGSQAGEAWAAGYTGNKSVHVVIIDEGVQTTHPDLSANVWTNPYETAGNGIDDDKNGYIDDVNGWDFVNNDKTVYDSTADDHATHVAGTIGGVGGNGAGVAGVNWNVTMISAKFLGSTGGSTSNAIKAVDYATNLKTLHPEMDIVATSNSWGGGGFTQGLLDAIGRGGQKDILFIAAAGNSGTNNDTTASYPSNYNCSTGTTYAASYDCVVAVAAIDSNGALASFSQYGATTVDLGAPGVSINSTLPSNTYGSYSGTSMATPHVSGAAALCASIGSKRGSALKSALLGSTAATASLSGKTSTGGRLDAGALVGQCGGGSSGNTAPAVTISSPATTSFLTTQSITFTASATDAQDGSLSSSITWKDNGVALGTGATITKTLTGGTHVITASATDNGGLTGSASITLTVSSSTLAKPDAPTNVVAKGNKGTASVTWTQGYNGGSALTGQTVVVYNGAGTRIGTVAASATATSVNVRLQRGSYSFGVTATNAQGTSLESTRSATVTVS